MTTLSMPKSSLSQNSSPKECLTTMVALETKNGMKSLPRVEFTMQTKGAYGSVIYMHLWHLPPPIVTKVYHYVWARVYNGVVCGIYLLTEPFIQLLSLFTLVRHSFLWGKVVC